MHSIERDCRCVVKILRTDRREDPRVREAVLLEGAEAQLDGDRERQCRIDAARQPEQHTRETVLDDVVARCGSVATNAACGGRGLGGLRGLGGRIRGIPVRTQILEVPDEGPDAAAHDEMQWRESVADLLMY